MDLSILIPMYNTEKYIERCLNSLINQDIPREDYEIIIMDDGSNDNCKVLAGKYQRKYKNVSLYAEKNEGVYPTRNKLLKLAKGEYIYFVDADDCLAHNSLRHLLKFAKAKNLDILGFETQITSCITSLELKQPIFEVKVPKICEGFQFIAEHRHMRHEIWWYFVRREFLEKTNIVFDCKRFSADVVFTIKLYLNANRVSLYPVSVYRYVLTPNSIIRSRENKHRRRLIECQMIMLSDLSTLINSIECHSGEIDRRLMLKNLKYRRDMFLFFLILRMIRIKYSLREAREVLQFAKKMGAYPIKNFLGKEYSTLKYKILNFIVNHKGLLYSAISLYGMLSPNKKDRVTTLITEF
jgi:glycosyltransferase involved in cell wall biosynthesis